MKTLKSLPIYIISFLIPIIIVVLAYLNLSIYPGGTNTLIIYDLKGELLPTYGYLSNHGPGYDTLLHCMSGALGGGFLGRMAHVLSFFDLVYCFVPVVSIPDVIYFVTILRVGFCGLCMSVFLVTRHGKDINGLCIIFFSTCYALMSYIFIYALWPLWLDMVMLFPLLALSVEKIISGKKNPLFVLILSLAIISDYHISYMMIIALTIYFFFRLVEDGVGSSECKKRIVSYIVHGIISAGLSSFVLFPIVCDLMIGKLSVGTNDSELVLIKNTLLDVFKSFIPGSYTTLQSNASPNVFCGSIVTLLAITWFVYGRKEIKARLAGAFVVLLYFASFIIGPLDWIWHAFRDPSGFSVRYSFTFVFFIICFAVRGFINLKKFKLRFSRSLSFIISMMLVAYSFFELYVNGSYILAKLSVDIGYTNRKEYFRNYEFMTELVGMADTDSGGDYYRLYKDFNYSYFDGALYGYDGLLILDSSLNPLFISFMNDIGIGAAERLIDERGITPPTASLFDFGYYLSSSADSNSYDKIGEFNHHYLYKNDYALPLIFETFIDPDDDFLAFTDDPFENINIIYSDILGERTDIFVKQDCKLSYPTSENYHSNHTMGALDLFFTPDDEGNYWLYSDFVEMDKGIFGAVDEYGFSVNPIYAYYFLNDIKLGSFRETNYSYCRELGQLKSNEEIKVSLDTSYSEIGNTYIYRYDENEFRTIFESVNRFSISDIGNKGITALGEMLEDGYAFISLPYNPGYSIYIDGKKIDYSSYRDTFMLVEMNAGLHEIHIVFIPQGLYPGILVSILFLIIMIVYFRFDNTFLVKKLLNIRETLT